MRLAGGKAPAARVVLIKIADCHFNAVGVLAQQRLCGYDRDLIDILIHAIAMAGLNNLDGNGVILLVIDTRLDGSNLIRIPHIIPPFAVYTPGDGETVIVSRDGRYTLLTLPRVSNLDMFVVVYDTAAHIQSAKAIARIAGKIETALR